MNYKQIYEKLINTRRLLNRQKGNNIYYERHHILPHCLGGLKQNNNLILLKAKEHFIAHLLLTKIYVGKNRSKMVYALWRMCHKSKNHKRITSAQQYQKAKELLKTITGEDHFFKGKKLKIESIQKRTSTRIKNGNGIYSPNPNRIGHESWVKGKEMPKYIVLKQTESRKKNGCYIWSKERKNKHKIAMKNSRFSEQAIKNSVKKRQRLVLQFDLENNFIQEWPSIRTANKELNLTTVSDCVTGKQKRAGQFIFKYK